MQWRAAFFVLGVIVCACGGGDSPPGSLRVNVRTDFAPGIDFGSIDVEAGRRLLQTDIRAGANYLLGAEVAAFTGLELGDIRVRVTLFAPNGAPLLQRSVLTRVTEEGTVTVVLSRACEGETCPEGSACNNGVCVGWECAPENPDACGTSPCTTAADCPTIDESCGGLMCSRGECLFETRECEAGEFCVPDLGCETPPTLEDAGVADEGAVDMDVNDARDDGPSDAGDAAVDADAAPDATAPPAPWPLGASIEVLSGSRVDASDRFGESVDISEDGEVLVVGAPQDASSERGVSPIADNDDLPNAGAVYVFRRNADASWTEEAYIKAESPDAEARFGMGVSISPSGHRIVVLTTADRGAGEGADSEPFGAVVAPAVTIFERGSEGWRQESYLRGPAGSAPDRVHLARNADCILTSGSRSIVFARVGGAWLVRESVAPMADEARLASDCSIMVERFGGDRVTTYRFDTRTLDRRGLSSTTPPEGDVGSDLGFQIRLSESAERLALSRPQHNSMGERAGTILILSRVDDTWNPETTLRSNEPIAGEELGHVMAMNAAGTRVVAMGDGGFFFEPRMHFWEQTDSPSRWEHRGDLNLAEEVPRGTLDPSSLAVDRLGNRIALGEGRSDRVVVVE